MLILSRFMLLLLKAFGKTPGESAEKLFRLFFLTSRLDFFSIWYIFTKQTTKQRKPEWVI